MRLLAVNAGSVACDGHAVVTRLFRSAEPYFALVEDVPVFPWDLWCTRLGRVSTRYSVR